MGTLRSFGTRLCLIGAACATFASVSAQSSVSNLGSHIVVIVSAQSRTREMSIDVVRDIFLGVPTFVEPGDPYVPIAHAARTPVRNAFDQHFLGLDPDAVGRYWIDQRIRARARPPRTIPSIDTLRRVVAALPQAISYIRADQLQPGLVPIKIDGVDFRSPEYRYQMSLLMRSGALGLRQGARL